MTPALILSIREGYMEAMRYLLANGARIPNIPLNTSSKEVYDYLKRKNVDITFDPNNAPINFIEESN